MAMILLAQESSARPSYHHHVRWLGLLQCLFSFSVLAPFHQRNHGGACYLSDRKGHFVVFCTQSTVPRNVFIIQRQQQWLGPQLCKNAKELLEARLLYTFRLSLRASKRFDIPERRNVRMNYCGVIHFLSLPKGVIQLGRESIKHTDRLIKSVSACSLNSRNPHTHISTQTRALSQPDMAVWSDG